MVRDLGADAPTWGGAAFDIAGELDPAALEAVLLQWIARHETLRSGLRVAGQELERFTLSADAISLDRSVVGQFTCGPDVIRYLEDRFDEVTSPLTWPAYLIATVVREDDFTVYLAFDHSNVDAYSIAQIPYEIHELYAATISGSPAQLADVGSYVDFSKIERESADHINGDHESVACWRDFVETCGGGLPAFPLDLGVAPGEVPRQVAMCEWLLDQADTKAFDDACKAAGGNALAGVLAVASIVAYELGGEQVYRTVMPFHTRFEVRLAASLGWYIGLAPITIDTARARDFAELISMARDVARAAKPVAQVPFAKVCSLLDSAVRPLTMLSYMDGRMIPGARRWEDWKAHGFGKVSYGDEAFIWVNRSIDGLYLTYRYPSTDVAHASMAGFVERTRAVLASVAANGSYSVGGRLAPQPAPILHARGSAS